MLTNFLRRITLNISKQYVMNNLSSTSATLEFNIQECKKILTKLKFTKSLEKLSDFHVYIKLATFARQFKITDEIIDNIGMKLTDKEKLIYYKLLKTYKKIKEICDDAKDIEYQLDNLN